MRATLRRPTCGSNSIELEYLGTAGFVVRGKGRTLVLDPYVSRLPLHKLWRPLAPDESADRARDSRRPTMSWWGTPISTISSTHPACADARELA